MRNVTDFAGDPLQKLYEAQGGLQGGFQSGLVTTTSTSPNLGGNLVYTVSNASPSAVYNAAQIRQ